jgi:hypothetical protein
MPGAPTLDSEMGAGREGATGVPGERAVGDRSRPSTPADALRLPNTITRAAPRAAARGRISITTSVDDTL